MNSLRLDTLHRKWRIIEDELGVDDVSNAH